MAPKKRSHRSEPKVFRCTGFGNCNMVFTRSEHLARHARKHTGEKPFKCIVPGCDRMFSRFDNMMQHTHTHERQKKRMSVGSAAAAAADTASSIIVTGPPTPPHGDDGKTTMLESRTLPLPLAPPNIPKKQQRHRHYHMFASPPPALPSLPRPWQQHPTPPPPPHRFPPPVNFAPLSSHCRMSAIDLYSIQSKRLSMEEPNHHHHPPGRRRRLSLVDLQTPIDHWLKHPPDESSDPSSTVEVTLDEYEAIQGFGRFRAQSQTKPAPATAAGDQTHLPIPLPAPSPCP